MKPSFALTLSNDRVGLLHRTPKGWMPVGDCVFGSPDFDASLEYLRSTALGLSPKGITTKLVIPNSEILYLEVEAPGADANTRRRQIRTALKDKTPYPVEELIFDSWGKGPLVQVAVVWKGTLDEAEAFADEHRFNPVSFVAIPDEGKFKGEPWFGMTKVAGTILSAGEKVERDQDPILLSARELARIEPADTAQAPAPAARAAEPTPPVPAAPQVPAAPEMPTAPAEAPVEIPAAPPEVPEPTPAESPDAEPDQPESAPIELPDAPPEFGAPPRPIPEFHVRRTAPPAVVVEPVSAEPLDPAPTVVAPTAPAGIRVGEEAPMAVDVPPEPEPTPVAVTADDVPPMPAGLAGRRPVTPAPRASVAEAARRASADPAMPSGLSGRRTIAGDEDELPPEPSPAALAAFASRRAPDAPPRPVTPPARGVLSDGPNSFRPPVERAAARPAAARPATETAPAAAPRPAARADATVKGLGAPVTSPTIPGAGKPRRVEIPPPPEGATPPPRPSRASKTGLGSKPMPATRGKPKYLGLILTAVLLALLIAVAAWSSFYVSQNDRTADPAVDVASATPEPELTPEEIAALNEAEAEADGQLPEDASTATAETAAAPEAPALDAPLSAASPEPASTSEVASVDPAATAAPAAALADNTDTAAAAQTAEPAPATPIGDTADAAPTPANEPQDEIFLAAMDQPPETPDPVALPGPTALADSAPGFQMPPPAFGTVYQFDENGLLVPTKEGILTPDGVMLIAGRPSKLPPERPATVTEAATAAAAALAAEVAAAQAAATPGAIAAGAAAAPGPDSFVSDPALGEFKPKERPENLTPPAAAAGDDASLAPAADSRFASLRPRARTNSAIDAAVAASTAVADASLVNTETSQLAVQVSMKPAARPKDMSRAVEAAVAAAVSQPAPEPEPEAQAEVQVASAQPVPAKPAKPAAKAKAEPAPEADEEPEVDTSRDRSPALKGVVAKKATFVNALNLSKTSLIGVYGTPSKRYALVRMSNGRYKKVKVGDSLDGGRVAAISQSELTYSKGSRSYTLSMPKG